MKVYIFTAERLDGGGNVEGCLLYSYNYAYIVTEANPSECMEYGYIEINEYFRVKKETIKLKESE